MGECQGSGSCMTWKGIFRLAASHFGHGSCLQHSSHKVQRSAQLYTASPDHVIILAVRWLKPLDTPYHGSQWTKVTM